MVLEQACLSTLDSRRNLETIWVENMGREGRSPLFLPHHLTQHVKYYMYFLFFFFCFVSFLGPHPQHMQVPRLGVESELQLLVYTTAIPTPHLQPIPQLAETLDP